MWEEKIIVWEKTNHLWDDLGDISSYTPDNNDDPMYAKLLLTWKQQTLGGLVRGVLKAIKGGLKASKFIEDDSFLIGFTLILVVTNLFPMDLNLIQDDDKAEVFLKLLKEDEEGVQYFIREELNNYGEISFIIDYFLEREILEELGNKLIVKGRVLNRVHIKD